MSNTKGEEKMTKKEIERLEAENKVMKRALERFVSFSVNDLCKANREFLKEHSEYKFVVLFGEMCAKAEMILEKVNGGEC